jgi:hypothetical protein
VTLPCAHGNGAERRLEKLPMNNVNVFACVEDHKPDRFIGFCAIIRAVGNRSMTVIATQALSNIAR